MNYTTETFSSGFGSEVSATEHDPYRWSLRAEQASFDALDSAWLQGVKDAQAGREFDPPYRTEKMRAAYKRGYVCHVVLVPL